eukprot:460722-Amphidinium_carterae.1
MGDNVRCGDHKARQFPRFRAGALSVAGTALSRIIATYTSTPPLRGAGSSHVCRYPIALLMVAPRQAFPGGGSGIAAKSEWEGTATSGDLVLETWVGSSVLHQAGCFAPEGIH